MVLRRQLLALGFSPSAIDRLVGAGRLHALHAGVYAVGHTAISRRGDHLAAALSCGSRTVTSRRSSAMLHGLLFDDDGVIHITTASGRRGVLVHETRRLTPADITRIDGIPTCSLARALLDVAGHEPPGVLARAFNAERFLQLVVGPHELPPPVPQSSPLPHRPQRVDFAWPRERVVVEVDGREWHAIQATWGEDHERDLRLRLAGWDPHRYTHRQLTRTAELVAVDLRSALHARRTGVHAARHTARTH